MYLSDANMNFTEGYLAKPRIISSHGKIKRVSQMPRNSDRLALKLYPATPDITDRE